MDLNSVRVGIVSLTVGHWDLMQSHISSIYTYYPHPKEFFIIPNVDFGMPLSAAINRGFVRAARECDFIFYIADDIQIMENTMQEMLRQHILNDALVSIGRGSWDCFIIQPSLFKTVGLWDESFAPAYFEDNDYVYRIKMAGLDDRVFYCDGINYYDDHSATLKRFTPEQRDRHSGQFERCKRLYMSKWGGMPLSETFTQPWNGAPAPDFFEGIPVVPIRYLNG